MRRLEAEHSDGAVGFVEPEEHLLPGGPWPALIRALCGGRSLRPVRQWQRPAASSWMLTPEPCCVCPLGSR